MAGLAVQERNYSNHAGLNEWLRGLREHTDLRQSKVNDRWQQQLAQQHATQELGHHRGGIDQLAMMMTTSQVAQLADAFAQDHFDFNEEGSCEPWAAYGHHEAVDFHSLSGPDFASALDEVKEAAHTIGLDGLDGVDCESIFDHVVEKITVFFDNIEMHAPDCLADRHDSFEESAVPFLEHTTFGSQSMMDEATFFDETKVEQALEQIGEQDEVAGETLFGTDGDDILVANNSNIFLNGGAGDDTFVFVQSDPDIDTPAAYVIQDFTQGEDKVDVSNFFNDFEALAGNIDGDVIHLDENTIIELQGLLNPLTSDDFIFSATT